MTDVRMLHPDHLDYRPRSVDLPDAPGPWSPVWSVRLSVQPGRSRIFRLDGALALANAPDGIVALGVEPPGHERALAGELLHAYRTTEHEPALIDSHGLLYRWSPGSPARQVWDAGAPGTKVDVAVIDGGRLLLGRKGGETRDTPAAASGAGWAIELIDPETKQIRWTRALEPRGTLPWNDSLFVVQDKRNTVLRLRLSDGEPAWERAVAGGVSNLRGIVGEQLWLMTDHHELMAMDVEQGKETVRVKVPVVAVPAGIIDEQGHYHVCGSYDCVLDLREGGRVLEQGRVAVSGGDTTISLAFGSGAAHTTDGRVVFHDSNGGIFAVRADRSPVAQVLRRPTSPLLGFGIANGLLYVLTRDGELSALRP